METEKRKGRKGWLECQRIDLGWGLTKRKLPRTREGEREEESRRDRSVWVAEV